MSKVKAATVFKDVSNVTKENEMGDADVVPTVSGTSKQTTNSNVATKLSVSATNPKLSPSKDQSTDTVIIDIDGDDEDDPLWSADYVKQMYKYYRSVELPIPNYMQNQTEVKAHSRAILVDWLIDVQKKSFSPSSSVTIRTETLYLIINVIDRYLGKKNVPLDDLQLVALGALLIGTKYEETFHFSIPELVDICANAYDEDEVVKVETEILEALDFRLTVPSSCTFLVRFLKAASKDMPCDIKTTTTLAKYILDVTLLSFHINQKYLPSELAAMAVFLSRKCMKLGCIEKPWPGPIWSETLWYHTEYSQRKLEQIAVDFIEEKKAIPHSLKALKRKYDVASFDKLLRRAFISLE